MDSIYPTSPKDPSYRVSGSKHARGLSQSEQTAAKVCRIQLPSIDPKTGLRGRQIALLKEAGELAKKIKSDWNLLAPEELAERIIELENKISLFEETTPEIEKVKKQAEHLHFQFVFPIALEVSVSEQSIPSFAKAVHQAANQIFKTHSLHAFHVLSRVQKEEVMRYAGGES